MPHFNTGRQVEVGDRVQLDGRTGVVTRIPTAVTGNEAAVTVEVTVPARLLEPVN